MINFYSKTLTKAYLLVLSVLLTSGISVSAQTSLTAGDIVFTAYDSTPLAGTGDSFSFVLLTDISSGTKISFTDRGYNGSGWQAAGSTESAVTWTSGSALTVGTEVYIVGLVASTYNPTNATSAVNGSVVLTEGSSTNGLSLSNVGDQIIAFQGTTGSITGAGSYAIAGINYFYTATTTAAGWNIGSATGPNSSLMPPGLTAGTSAFYTGPVGTSTLAQSGKFGGSGMPATTAGDIRTAVLNSAKWTLNTASVGQYSGSLFIAGVPVFTGNPANRTICSGGNTTFSVTATGATSYQWYQNAGSGFVALTNTAPFSGVTTTTLTITGATATINGTLYRCVATNTSGSVNSNSGTLTVVSVSSNGAKTDVSCNGGSNGSINLTPSGGIAPYAFNWSDGKTTEDRTGLSAGTYTVTVTDNIGCTATNSFVIAQPTAVSGTTVVTNISCNGGSNGTINLTPAGGTSPYTFNWGGGITTEDRTGLEAGTYTVIITDAKGCTATVNTTVTQPATVNAPTGNAVQDFPAGSNLGSLVVNGQNIKWYASALNASNHVNALPSTTIIVNNTTYYATQTVGVCESTSSLAVLAYNESLAVSTDIKSNSEFQIYPNPVKEVLNISGQEQILKIMIIAADGKKVTEKMMQKNDRSINVHALAQGNYLIKVFTKNNIQTFKFIKH